MAKRVERNEFDEEYAVDIRLSRLVNGSWQAECLLHGAGCSLCVGRQTPLEVLRVLGQTIQEHVPYLADKTNVD